MTPFGTGMKYLPYRQPARRAEPGWPADTDRAVETMRTPFGAYCGGPGAGSVVPSAASSRSRALTSWSNSSDVPPFSATAAALPDVDAFGCLRYCPYRDGILT